MELDKVQLTLTPEEADAMSAEEARAFVDNVVNVVAPKLLEITTMHDISPTQAKVAGLAIAMTAMVILGQELGAIQIVGFADESERYLLRLMARRLMNDTAAVHEARSEPAEHGPA